MEIVLSMPRRLSWIQRLFLLVLASNVALILLGIRVVPADLGSPGGLGALLGDIAMQVALAVLALVGPLSFQHYPRTIGISLALGALFAAAYGGLIAADFAGIQLAFGDTASIYALFLGIALLAGAAASARTHRLHEGVVAAIWALVIGTAIWSTIMLLLNYGTWGSHGWYQFWLGDGAVDDFHHSGSTDLAVFLLQDLQGALFFHPLLSAVLGAVGGLVGGGLALASSALCRHAPSQA